MIRVENLQQDDETSELVDAYLDLLRIRFDSPHREMARKAMCVLRDQIAERTGYSREDVQTACEVVGAH